jgi:DNA-binding response OmpR family regulator
MESPIIVADDKGLCFDEVRAILKDPGTEVLRAASMEDCIHRLRKTRASILIVSATMKRAFSLLRIVRHSRDLRTIPLLVIAAPGQEELIEKHGQLPSRADRYLLQPLDSELFDGVVREFLHGIPEDDAEASAEGVATMAPLDGVAPDKGAYQKIQDELRRSREKLHALEADLHAALQTSKGAADLRAENESLRKRIQSNDAQTRSTADYSSIFERLESGYKETIGDLERLIRDKDNLIGDLRDQLPSTDEIGVNTRELMSRIEAQNGRISVARDRAAKVLEVLSRARGQLDGLDLEGWLAAAREAEESVDLAFSEEESTQILDVSSIKNFVAD